MANASFSASSPARYLFGQPLQFPAIAQVRHRSNQWPMLFYCHPFDLSGETTIPNFICTHSPSIFLDFQGVSAFGVLAVTPFLHHFRIWLYWISSDYTILLKLLDGIIQRFGSHMNVPIHCCFDAGMTQQLLQHLRLHTAFNRSCSIGMSQGVHTKVLDPRFVAELI